MIDHYIKEKDIEILEGIFAFYTPIGWCVPAWVTALRRSMK